MSLGHRLSDKVNSMLDLIRSFVTELIRNLVGFFLVFTGVGVICLGAHWHMDILVTLGVSTMIPAAMLALQSKRTPEGKDPNDLPPGSQQKATTETLVNIPPVPDPKV